MIRWGALHGSSVVDVFSTLALVSARYEPNAKLLSSSLHQPTRHKSEPVFVSTGLPRTTLPLVFDAGSESRRTRRW